MLPSSKLETREYLDASGRSPFGEWFAHLDPTPAAKVTAAIARIEQGNLSSIKPVGEGVLEYRIDFGPGFRVYFGRDRKVLVVLLAGGTKRGQQRDIESAKLRWADYMRRRLFED